MRNHLIQVGFFGANESHKERLMQRICPSKPEYKYTIEKYDKIFNIHLKSIQNISCGCFDIHCMILVFDATDLGSFAHIRKNYDTIKQTVMLRNVASNCMFLLVCIMDKENSISFKDDISNFVNTERLLYVTVKSDNYIDFKHMYDQILKMNLLENISLQSNCVMI
jgi:hypothetical protein